MLEAWRHHRELGTNRRSLGVGNAGALGRYSRKGSDFQRLQ